MGYNALNDEIRDNVTRMRRAWEAQSHGKEWRVGTWSCTTAWTPCPRGATDEKERPHHRAAAPQEWAGLQARYLCTQSSTISSESSTGLHPAHTRAAVMAPALPNQRRLMVCPPVSLPVSRSSPCSKRVQPRSRCDGEPCPHKVT